MNSSHIKKEMLTKKKQNKTKKRKVYDKGISE